MYRIGEGEVEQVCQYDNSLSGRLQSSSVRAALTDGRR